MDTGAARTLRPWEGKRPHATRRQLSDAVNRRHGRIILPSRGGVRHARIAGRCGGSPGFLPPSHPSVQRRRRRRRHLVPVLLPPGGPREFPADVAEQVAEVALSPPKQLIGPSVWSLPKLRDYLVAQKVVTSTSVERLRQILDERKVRRRHGKTWKDGTDPEFRPKYRRIRRLYGRRPEGGRRISVDGFGPLDLLPRHGKRHARTGHAERMRATHTRRGGVRHMFGAYDLERDELVGTFAGRKNRATFLPFLKWLRRRYRSTEVLHVVPDNAGFHLEGEVLACAAAHRIKFHFTPTGGELAEPHRVPLHRPAEVRAGRHRLPHPRRHAGGGPHLFEVAQRPA